MRRLARAEERLLAAVGGVHGRTERAVALDEADLFHRLIALVRDVDPDIVVGYDVQNGSLGYLIERGAKLDINILRDLSRAPAEDPPRRNDGDEYGAEQESGIHVTGRVVLNVWRRMKSDNKLQHHARGHVADVVLAIGLVVVATVVVYPRLQTPNHKRDPRTKPRNLIPKSPTP